MERKNFAQVLKEAKIDLRREYNNIYYLFYKEDSFFIEYTFYSICISEFIRFPFRGTCISMSEFNNYHKFHFDENPLEVDINYLVNFCEYVYNFALCMTDDPEMADCLNIITTQINRVIEKIGYMETTDNDVSIFVPKSQPAIVVSETLPPKLSYKVIEYNHHSMKGNLARKQATLKLLADQLESREKELMGINKNFKSDLFYLINNLNIRHNNIDPTSKSYKEAVSKMSKEELEKWYDKAYELCLYAFMMLDNIDYASKTKELKTLLGEV